MKANERIELIDVLVVLAKYPDLAPVEQLGKVRAAARVRRWCEGDPSLSPELVRELDEAAFAEPWVWPWLEKKRTHRSRPRAACRAPSAAELRRILAKERNMRRPCPGWLERVIADEGARVAERAEQSEGASDDEGSM